MHRDLTEKTPILQYFKVMFVAQPSVASLGECEDKWFHKINGKINIQMMILPHTKLRFALLRHFC